MPFLSRDLERTLRRSLALAGAKRHRCATPEHLAVSLLDDPDVSAILENHPRELALFGEVRARLEHFIDHDLVPPVTDEETGVVVTIEVQRIIQNAAASVQSTEKDEVKGPDVLISIFTEPDTPAVCILRENGLDETTIRRLMSVR